MDIRYFFDVLWRRKWLIATVMLTAALATYFLVESLPEKFKSNAILSTGIIEFKGAKLSQDNPFYQQFQVDNAFDNLKEGILNRSTVMLLTKKLLQHDLRKDSNIQPFRLLTNNTEPISPEDLASFTSSLQNEVMDLSLEKEDPDPENIRLLNSLAKALEYDFESLKENLTVTRIGKTDYLKMDFHSENPALSFYALNTFCEEIIKLDRSVQTNEESDAVNFYKRLVKEKKHELDTLTRMLNQYNARQNLVDLQEQSKSIVGQLRELELLRERYNQEIPSLKSNISNLNQYIKQTARINADYYANSIFVNEDLQALRDEISRVNELYLKSGQTDYALKTRLDKLKGDRESLIKKIALSQTDDTDETIKRNRDLLDKRLEKELELNTAVESVESLDKEIGRLRSRQKNLVSNDAFVGNLEQQLTIVRKEYFDIVNKYQEAEQTSKKTTSRLSILESAQMPEKPESKKQALLSVFAGVSSGIMAIVLIFLVTFFDNSLNTPYKFNLATGFPLIGTLNKLKGKNIDFNQLFSGSTNSKDADIFLEEMRKIRYNIETSGARSILVTSNQAGAGKTFFVLALSYSLSLNNRRVLIIDSNFRNNHLSQLATLEPDKSPFVNGEKVSFVSKPKSSGKIKLPVLKGYLPKTVEVMGNSGGNLSPTEALGGHDLIKSIFQYQQEYDYIILEGAALNDYADSRELAMFADKIISIFSAHATLGSKDHSSLEFLEGLKGKFLGSILNELRNQEK